MEIKDRLIKIISSEGLTSAAFADSIGVQRSSISHIVSGRNNPSLDFLQKILIRYPKYNAEWLLMGLGDVYKHSNQTRLFNDSELIANTQVTLPKNEEIPSAAVNETKIDAIDHDNILSKTIKEEDKPLYGISQKVLVEQAIAKDKQIQKIVCFYSDKTFGEYQPE